jgi:Synergist-CTERM protein sorting domain-containing protein
VLVEVPTFPTNLKSGDTLPGFAAFKLTNRDPLSKKSVVVNQISTTYFDDNGATFDILAGVAGVVYQGFAVRPNNNAAGEYDTVFQFVVDSHTYTGPYTVAFSVKEAKPNAQVNYARGVLTGLEPNKSSGYTVDTSTVVSSNADGEITVLDGWMDDGLHKIKRNTAGLESDEQELTIHSRLPFTVTLTPVRETTGPNGTRDGRIDGVSTAMEYKLASGSDWTPVTGSSITGLASDSYNVRMKATSGNFASDPPQNVSVPVDINTTVTRDINVLPAATFEIEDALVGYSAAASVDFTVVNIGNWDTPIKAISASPRFVVGGVTAGSVVPKDGDIVGTITPVTGLAIGKYVGKLIVSYDHTSGITVTPSAKERDITFKVTETKPTVAIDYVNEKLTGFETGSLYDLKFGGDNWFQHNGSASELAISDDWISRGTEKLEIIKVNTDYDLSSAPQEIVITSRDVAPAAALFHSESVTGASDGSIWRVNDTMEWSGDNGATWNDVTGTTIDGLAVGDYLVRVKASPADKKFHSLHSASPIQVVVGDAQSRTLTITSQSPRLVLPSGYDADTAEVAIELTTTGNFETSIDTLPAISGPNADVFYVIGDLPVTVPYTPGIPVGTPGTDSTFKIKVSPDQIPGKYGPATVTVAYLGTLTPASANVVSTDVSLWVTEAAPGDDVVIDFARERIMGLVSGDSYIINQGGLGEDAFTADADGTREIINAWLNSDITIQKTNTDHELDSPSKTISVPAILPAPTGVEGSGNGTITGVDATMQYSPAGADSWTDVTGTTVTGLANGSYDVRLKATATNFASESVPVEVNNSGVPTSALLGVTAPTFDRVAPGYDPVAAKTIIINNTGNAAASNVVVTVSPTTAFTVAGSGSSVPAAGGSINTWTIKPIDGLSANTYTATITVTYDGGATPSASVTAPVTFIVEQPVTPPTEQAFFSTTESAYEIHYSVNDSNVAVSVLVPIGSGSDGADLAAPLTANITGASHSTPTFLLVDTEGRTYAVGSAPATAVIEYLQVSFTVADVEDIDDLDLTSIEYHIAGSSTANYVHTFSTPIDFANVEKTNDGPSGGGGGCDAGFGLFGLLLAIPAIARKRS